MLTNIIKIFFVTVLPQLKAISMNWEQTRVPLPSHPKKMICSTNNIYQIRRHEKTGVFSVGALLVVSKMLMDNN
jgi:hypothetical protein